MIITNRFTGKTFNAAVVDGRLVNTDTNHVLSGFSITMFLDEATEEERLALRGIGCALSGNAIYRIGLRGPEIAVPLPEGEPESSAEPPAILTIKTTEAEPDAVAKNWMIITLGLLFGRIKRLFS